MIPAPPASPAPRLADHSRAGSGIALDRSVRGPNEPAQVSRLDDWPRTTRILPWMIAAFMAMLWLLPFNNISLTVSLPFELKLDRILLPFIVIAWCISLAAGGRNAPRLRLTKIHVAIGTYVAVAFLSVIVNATSLNHTLMLQSSLKGLVLLSSYVTFFVIVASVVRPTEVRAYVKYSLILAVICGVGALWEYHFHYDIFYQWPRSVLPSLFRLPVPDASAIDELGRRLTLGPAEAQLELATMVAIALPIALVGVIRTKRPPIRMVYALAACVLLAAGFATYRKSSLVIPGVVVVTLALFRPRQVLRLAPVGLVLLVVVHFLAPGAIGSVTAQLQGSRLTSVGTTVHRTTGYDAVRPLVWTHPALGGGYGSYNANLKRILDSQILMSAIETGILGLGAYLAMTLAVLGSARSLFRKRESEWGWLALALGIGAIAFFTSSFLYDTMSFPHGPYIFLSFAALVAVLAGASTAHPRTRSASDQQLS